MVTRLRRRLLGIFPNSDINKLLLTLLPACVLAWLFLQPLAPLLGAILIAYVLDGAAARLQKLAPRLPRAAIVACTVATAVILALFAFYALPRFLLQLRELGTRIPEAGATMELVVQQINQFLPGAGFDHAHVAAKAAELTGDIATYLINNLFGYAGNLFSALVYLIMLPLLVFFLLRDKSHLANYLGQFLPTSPIFAELWSQLDEQFGSYIRGKIIEAALVGASMWIVLLLFQMQYALALAILVGLSVFVPFVGAIAVTFPIVLFSYLEFGWSADFGIVVTLYTIIQIIDGQILVPLLFSEVIRIHPAALFFSLIFFGNLWGVWGVFFAIPLASFIKCLIAVIMIRLRPPPP